MRQYSVRATPQSNLRRGNKGPSAIYIIAGLFLVGFIGLFLLFIWFSRDLPEPGKIKRSKGFSTTFYDRNDKVIYEMYKDQNRIPVSLSNISDYVKKGTIAIEDKDFYKHGGVSTKGILRAFISSILKQRVEGGSTLTQQLIKNVLLTPERSVTRKIKEFVLASEIEKRYTKDQILEMYLNEAPYGGTFWGIEAASKGYFGKTAKELNLVESAVLAGLPQLPSVYSPFIGKEGAYKNRTKAVLRRMRDDKAITKNEEIKALKDLEKLSFNREESVAITAPHFIFYATNQIVERFGKDILDKGIKVKTTLDLEVQKEAEKIVSEEIEKIKNLKATNGSAVVIDNESGDILAMVGSYDFNNPDFGRYNTATALRQPGSAIKPITYATALEKGYTASTVLMDVKTTFPSQGEKDYVPDNYDGLYRGPIQLRFALGNSINIPAVKLQAMIGLKDFLQKAYDFGLFTFEPTRANLNRFGLSITLGGGETRLVDLTNAYAAIGRGGLSRTYTSVKEIQNYTGKTMYKASKPQEKRVISEDVAFIISHILSDNNARKEVFGTRSYLNVPGRTVAAKTGTTNDKRDNWALGFTKSVSVGVWVGNNDNSPMDPKIASGATGASPIWYRLMIHLLKTREDGIIDKPSGVEAVEIDAYLGGLPREGQPKRTEYFVSGTQPKDVSSYYKKLKISKSTGQLANDIEIRLGDYTEKDYIVIHEDDPVSRDGKNRWQEAIDIWLVAQADEKYHSPTEVSSAKAEEMSVQIKDPQDRSRINSSTITVKAKIATIDPIVRTELFVDGSVVKTYGSDVKDISEEISLSDGIHIIRVRSENSKGKTGDSVVSIGINKDWEAPTATP